MVATSDVGYVKKPIRAKLSTVEEPREMAHTNLEIGVVRNNPKVDEQAEMVATSDVGYVEEPVSSKLDKSYEVLGKMTSEGDQSEMVTSDNLIRIKDKEIENSIFNRIEDTEFKQYYLELSTALQKAREDRVYEEVLCDGDKTINSITPEIMARSETIRIPARVKKFVEVQLEPIAGISKDILCHSEEIIPGVYLANSVSKAQNNKIICSIINTKEEEVTLKDFRPKVEHLSSEDYDLINPQGNLWEETKCYSLDNPRTQKVLDLLEMDKDIPQEHTQELETLIVKYADIFHLEGETLSCTDTIRHSINTLADTPPINQKNFRLPEACKEEIDRQIQEMLDNDIIAHSNSPWNSPLLLVPKRDSGEGSRKWRVVIDFRKLNKSTIGDAFPLPRIEEILDQLGNSRYFSTLDLANGYHQIPIREEDREKTAFSSRYGHYEFKRLPFGLAQAPATFQRMMNHVLTGLNGLICFVYLDDIIVYGRDIEDHNRKLGEIFERIRAYNLKLQPSKTKLLRREVSYLGHICGADGVRPDPQRTAAVHNYPVPTTVRQVQSFLGFASYYRKFIPHMAEKTLPLTKLLRSVKKGKLIWSPECEKAFLEIREALASPPLLKYPNFEEEFILTTDASNEALGAYLSQGKPGSEQPVAYASRCLGTAERNYSTIERELLAIVWATKTFRCYLYGRKFTAYTDHKPLVGQLKLKNISNRLLRLQTKLIDYDIQIEYRPGRQNAVADALSRIILDSENIEPKCLALTRAQANKNKADEINKSNSIQEHEIDEVLREIEIPIIKPKRIPEKIEITDDKMKLSIIKEAHNGILGGHLGIKKTLERIRYEYVWSGMKNDITNFINKCQMCQEVKSGRKTRMPMYITDTSFEPFQKVYLDIVGPLPVTTSGNKYILTFEDDLTKYFDCYALPDMEANTVARVFFDEIISRYRIPKMLITDQGSNFMSETFNKVCKLLGIKKMNCSAYHPQSNGSLERAHRPLADYLRCFVEKDKQWDKLLRQASFVRNNSINMSTKFTPMSLLFGFRAELPSGIKVPPTPIYDVDNYYLELRHKLRSSYEIARKNQIAAKELAKRYYDRNTNEIYPQVGDQIFIFNQAKQDKLDKDFKGPYEVIKVNDNNTCQIKIKNKLKTINNNRIKIANLPTPN